MRTGVSYLLRKAFAQTEAAHFASRRKFLKRGAMAATVLALPNYSCSLAGKPTVAIVGGGIAGLTASYQLSKAGIENTVYEASGRVGGRVLTVPDAVVEGAHVDFGAEFIDSVHTDLLEMANEFGVEVADLTQDNLTSKAYFFEGKMRSEEDIVEALQPFAEQLTKDIQRIPADIHYSKAEAFGDLDAQSVTSYLKGIGMEGWLLRFFEMAMEGEYAMNASEQSAINLLIMLAIPFEYDAHYHLLGNYHEVFKFKGGSQSFIDALSKRTEKQIKLGHRLKAISMKDERPMLTFEFDGSEKTIEADYLILAIPFTVLRDVHREFKFPERKEKWIAEAGMGNAVKLAMGFQKRVWREAGYQGYTFSDATNVVFWDSAQMVPTGSGSLTFAGGGATAVELSEGSYEAVKTRLLPEVEKIFPGISEAYNNQISRFPWAAYPFSKGSYTCYKVGQWSAFAGVEAEPFGKILFAGEHCSLKHQGFMNGAVETGRQAARMIGDWMIGG